MMNCTTNGKTYLGLKLETFLEPPVCKESDAR
jgi:hypothetical protein